LVKPAVHIIEVWEYAVYGDDGVDIATRRTRAELRLGVLESEEVAYAGEKKLDPLKSHLYIEVYGRALKEIFGGEGI
jgi:hypothetical protein